MEELMQLGAFSISLTVKDIYKSKQFYEKLGFRIFGGNIHENWLIMQNENCTIGLFQGMFPKNMLTFNPGWNDKAEKLENFTDVRDLQKQLREQGISFDSEVGETDSGPGSFIITDPDGNPILFDQHV